MQGERESCVYEAECRTGEGSDGGHPSVPSEQQAFWRGYACAARDMRDAAEAMMGLGGVGPWDGREQAVRAEVGRTEAERERRKGMAREYARMIGE